MVVVALARSSVPSVVDQKYVNVRSQYQNEKSRARDFLKDAVSGGAASQPGEGGSSHTHK